MDLSEKERKDARMTMLHEIRLMIDADEKETFKKEELLQLLDTIARAKDAE